MYRPYNSAIQYEARSVWHIILLEYTFNLVTPWIQKIRTNEKSLMILNFFVSCEIVKILFNYYIAHQRLRIQNILS